MHKQRYELQKKHLSQPDRLPRCSSGISRNSSRSIKNSSRSPCIIRSSHSESTTYDQHCRILESGAALCRAKIAIIAGGGGRGMVAAQQIAAGENVLEIAAASVLSVPKHAEAVTSWRKWLSLHIDAHGDLPDVLAEFLADTSLHHSVRLATWLLYLKQQCSNSNCADSKSDSVCNNSSSKSSSVDPFWCSYIAVLQQGGAMTAVCTGEWQEAELQLLEPPSLRDWLICHHHAARKATLAAYSTLAGGHSPLANLGLASNSADVGWALGLVKTRAHGDADRLSLYPLHGLINHRERGQANVSSSGAATVAAPEVGCMPQAVLALLPGCQPVNVPTGYRYVLQAVTALLPGEEITNCYTAPMANPQMLLGWGFTQPAKRADWVMAVPLQYGVLPQVPWKLAVHAAANVALRYKETFRQDAFGSKQQQQQPEDRSETSDKAKIENHISRLVTAAANLPLQLPEDIWDGGQAYTAAAAALAAQMTTHSSQQQQQQQQPGDIFMPLIGSVLQQEKIETLFMRDLHIRMQQKQQQLHFAAAGTPMTTERGQQQQQLQSWTAAVIRHACLTQLVSCNTTVDQEASLLQQLQQRQDTPTVPHLYMPLPPQQQQQQQQVHARQLVLHQLNQLLQQLVCSLAVLSAYCNLASMCDATAAAAQTVLQALEQEVRDIEQQLQLPHWQQRGLRLRAATASVMQHLQPQVQQMLEQQDSLLKELRGLRQERHISPEKCMLPRQRKTAGVSQQQQQQQQQPIVPAGGVTMLNPARYSAAVAARLEQKQLLAATAELCEELHNLLAVSDTGK